MTETTPTGSSGGGRDTPSGASEPRLRPVVPPMIEVTRSVTVRDFVIFQLKLVIDGLKDLVLFNLAIGALLLDLVSGGGKRPRVFYKVLRTSERFDLWLNLNGAMERLDTSAIGDDGLFGASEAGSDTLLGKIEQMVRGGDEPRGGGRDRGRTA